MAPEMIRALAEDLAWLRPPLGDADLWRWVQNQAPREVNENDARAIAEAIRAILAK